MVRAGREENIIKNKRASSCCQYDFEGLYRLFSECLEAEYTKVENDASFAFLKSGDLLKIYFEKSNGSEDWKNNFRFCAVAYNDMKNKWRCHRGFLSVWRAAEPYLRDVILDASVKRVLVVGYSHGAAIATLCHEYIWFNRPDLRENLNTFAFGTPRVIWGVLPRRVCARWRGLLRIKNREDIVTHLPPAFLGYRHVGKALPIGCIFRGGFVRAHYPERYQRELLLCREKNALDGSAEEGMRSVEYDGRGNYSSSDKT